MLGQNPDSPSLSSTRKAATTLGIVLSNEYVKEMVPGGPAQLSGVVQNGDKIVSVDGKAVSPHEVEAALVGSDKDGTSVCLELRKEYPATIVSCELKRVTSTSLSTRAALCAALTTLKDSAQKRNDSEGTRAATAAFEHTFAIMTEVRARDLEVRDGFREVYSDMRRQLLEALQQVEQLKSGQSHAGTPSVASSVRGEGGGDETVSAERERLRHVSAQLEAEKSALGRRSGQLLDTQMHVAQHLQNMKDQEETLRSHLSKVRVQLDDREVSLAKATRETERLRAKVKEQQEANQALADYCEKLRGELDAALQANHANEPPQIQTVGLAQQLQEHLQSQSAKESEGPSSNGEDHGGELQALLAHNRALGESLSGKASAKAPSEAAAEWSSRVKELEGLLEKKEGQLTAEVKARLEVDQRAKETAFKLEAEAGRLRHHLSIETDRKEAAELRFKIAEQRLAEVQVGGLAPRDRGFG